MLTIEDYKRRITSHSRKKIQLTIEQASPKSGILMAVMQ